MWTRNQKFLTLLEPWNNLMDQFKEDHLKVSNASYCFIFVSFFTLALNLTIKINIVHKIVMSTMKNL